MLLENNTCAVCCYDRDRTDYIRVHTQSSHSWWCWRGTSMRALENTMRTTTMWNSVRHARGLIFRSASLRLARPTAVLMMLPPAAETPCTQWLLCPGHSSRSFEAHQYIMRLAAALSCHHPDALEHQQPPKYKRFPASDQVCLCTCGCSYAKVIM